mmetsp:Transcript_16927/g.15185  ORF Transcript_16927/g.15185 Transcript_16927/m.15185 type:complete len:285 (+) Transcript_16927:61-915(+)
MSSIEIESSSADAEYVIVNTEDRGKFEKMVLISKKLYSSDIFKNKADRTKRRKLVFRLRILFDQCKFKNEEFEGAVIKSGWKDFKQWLQETNAMKLESDKDQIKLYEMMNNRKEINWSFIIGPELNENNKLLKELVDLTSKLMKEYYDESKHLGPWNSDKMGKELSDKDSHCIIIRNNINNELIGYVCFRTELNVINLEEDFLEFYVYELMIDSKYQRQRYGEYLMNICEFIAESKECDYIELTVFASNIPAIKFYRKQLDYDFDKNELDDYKSDYRILTKILS